MPRSRWPVSSEQRHYVRCIQREKWEHSTNKSHWQHCLKKDLIHHTDSRFQLDLEWEQEFFPQFLHKVFLDQLRKTIVFRSPKVTLTVAALASHLVLSRQMLIWIYTLDAITYCLLTLSLGR